MTALGCGQTILVLVDRALGPTAPAREIILSPAAARLLVLAGNGDAAVRVRGVVASAADLAALKAGRPAARRLAAPPALLAALRQRLRAPSAEPVTAAQRPAASPPKVASAAPRPAVAKASTVKPTPPPAPRAVQGKYLVQVAALSDAARARALARTLDGHVETAGTLHRVRLGPFVDMKSAQRARDDAKRRGYGDATILTQP
ncbi:SPOR domain-containing protein [Sphingomonas dokdonensis]|uniref:SPOR domain-containing protein n=1 Tax=Sphingomonas dokdonensis TaxID=344880 RepID=UPI001B807316|nr:SPOR domain-containing protein [Sphingomonas dokdonensis]